MELPPGNDLKRSLTNDRESFLLKSYLIRKPTSMRELKNSKSPPRSLIINKQSSTINLSTNDGNFKQALPKFNSGTRSSISPDEKQLTHNFSAVHAKISNFYDKEQIRHGLEELPNVRLKTKLLDSVIKRRKEMSELKYQASLNQATPFLKRLASNFLKKRALRESQKLLEDKMRKPESPSNFIRRSVLEYGKDEVIEKSFISPIMSPDLNKRQAKKVIITSFKTYEPEESHDSNKISHSIRSNNSRNSRSNSSDSSGSSSEPEEGFKVAAVADTDVNIDRFADQAQYFINGRGKRRTIDVHKEHIAFAHKKEEERKKAGVRIKIVKREDKKLSPQIMREGSKDLEHDLFNFLLKNSKDTTPRELVLSPINTKLGSIRRLQDKVEQRFDDFIEKKRRHQQIMPVEHSRESIFNQGLDKRNTSSSREEAPSTIQTRSSARFNTTNYRSDSPMTSMTPQNNIAQTKGLDFHVHNKKYN